MNSQRLISLLQALAGTALLGIGFTLAHAADTAASAPGGRPPGPPPEAIAACKGKTEGATVSFTGRRGDTLTGTCQLTPDGVLAARPAGGPPGGPGGQRPPSSSQ